MDCVNELFQAAQRELIGNICDLRFSVKKDKRGKFAFFIDRGPSCNFKSLFKTSFAFDKKTKAVNDLKCFLENSLLISENLSSNEEKDCDVRSIINCIIAQFETNEVVETYNVIKNIYGVPS